MGVALLLGMVVTVHLFLRYEETEDKAIRDFAFRDIGGFLVGFSGALIGGAVALLLPRLASLW